MLDIIWIQHPVGHGGFHTGHARVNDGSHFNWIFDCGSRMENKFNLFLKSWTTQNQQPVDWLFISHFDTDHVSGIDTLMARSVVRDVMIPYVNEAELAFQLLHEISQGNLNRTFFELVADPAAFFLGRGANRVTFLGGQSPGGETIAAGPRPEEGPRDASGWSSIISPLPELLPTPRMNRSAHSKAPRVQLIKGNCDIAVAHGPSTLRLKPYRAPIVTHAHQGLIADLRAEVGNIPGKIKRPGLGDLAFAISHHARTATGRAALCKLFKKYIGSSNRSSLSLLSIPDIINKNNIWHVSSQTISNFGTGEAGWLNTGDAEILEESDLNYWKNAYAKKLSTIRVLALPHHGSDKNSNVTLQKLCPQAALVVHVKAGAKKHPGLNVTAFAGERLACVTEHAGTGVRMCFNSHT